MIDPVEKLDIECKMIAEFSPEAAVKYRWYVLMKTAEHKYPPFNDGFIYCSLRWESTEEGPKYWNKVDNYLIDKYGTCYSYKDYKGGT